jgi:hypothetical protein
MKPQTKSYVVSLIFSLTMGLMTVHAAEPLPVKKISFPGEEEPAKKKKGKSKPVYSMNNASVKIYPDAFKRSMHVIAKESESQKLEFFVFDLQGTLVQNHKMNAKDHIKIEGLARGSYIYRVFSGDEETASGKFEIR